MVLWIESHAAVIAGDTLVDFGHGLEINPRWLGPTLTREDVVGPLRPLLDLPVEHALATHGGPFGRAAWGTRSRLAACPGQQSSAGDREFLLRPLGDRLQRAYGRLDVVDLELAQ
jgi:hypothetical protein